jgi:hypothetical protein
MRSVIVPIALSCLATLAKAETITSQYTKYNIDKCEKRFGTPGDEESVFFMCPGLKAIKVYFAEGDLRTLIAYGKNPETHCAAKQTFGGFNTATPTIEWRIVNGKAFAAIQRWTVSDFDDSSKTKTWLGVTKLEGNNSCRVAIVEGSLPGANAKARKAADQLARTFNCTTTQATVISKTPMPADELMSGTPCLDE